jgi:hypothetical protein
VHRPVTDDPEAEIRTLAGEVRHLWGMMGRNLHDVHKLGDLRGIDRWNAELLSMDYRIACRKLTAALLAHPEPVMIDPDTCLLPSEDGADPAFLPLPMSRTGLVRRQDAAAVLRRHLVAHRRRFAASGRARVPA